MYLIIGGYIFTSLTTYFADMVEYNRIKFTNQITIKMSTIRIICCVCLIKLLFKDLGVWEMSRPRLLVVDVWHHLPTIISGWVVMNVTTYHLKQWCSAALTLALCGLTWPGLSLSLFCAQCSVSYIPNK